MLEGIYHFLTEDVADVGFFHEAHLNWKGGNESLLVLLFCANRKTFNDLLSCCFFTDTPFAIFIVLLA